MFEKFKKLLYFCHMQCEVVCKVKKQLNLLNLYHMKRTLLFSAAILAAVGVSVNAETSQCKNMELTGLVETTTSSQQSVKKLISKGVSSADFSGYQFGKKAQASGDEFSAMYMLPQGSFYWSPDLNNGSYRPNWVMAPAYGDITFLNLTKGATSQTWTYEEFDPTSETGTKTLTSTDVNLTVNYPFGLFGLPSLEASNGSQKATYQFGNSKGLIFTGGNPAVIIRELGSQAGFDGSEVMMGAVSNTATDDGWGPLENQKNTWYGQLANANDIQTSGLVQGFGMMLLKPDVPYALSRVFFNMAELTGDKNAELTLTVYKIEEKDGGNYITDEVLATATAKVGDALNAYYENTYWLGFEFKNKVGELVRNLPLTLKTGAFLQVTAPEGVLFAPAVTLSSTNFPDYFNSYVVFEDGVLLPLHYIGFRDESGSKEYGVSAWNSAFDVTYTWLFSTDDDYRFDAPVDGGSKTFNVNCLYAPDSWDVTDSQDAIGDWVDYTTFYDDNTGDMTLTFDVAELPSEIKDRYTSVTVSVPGSSARFTIAQGDGSSVEGVETSAVVVSVVDGNFVVKGSNASVVDVYNVAGQKVASAVVDGETVVNAQDLAKGMYILKFNDNTAIKVVK